MERERGCADLHIHTVFSDGTFTPREMVRRAKEAGISAISITDHDSVEGVAEGIRSGEEFGIEVIPGMELSAWVEDQEIHILGYLVEHQDEDLLETLRSIRELRVERAQEIVSRLGGMGVSVELGEVKEIAGIGALGRPHIAEVLVRKGYVRSYEEAFSKFIANGKPAYVPKCRWSSKEVFSVIKRAGGISVFAHPGLEGKDDLLPQLVAQGLEGIEVWCGGASKSTIVHYQELAREYGLLMTGGSDSHGSRSEQAPLGSVTVPYELVEELKRAKAASVLDTS